MTDRTETVLNRIDATLNACICGQPIPDTGPSPDYCTEACQYTYTAAIVGAEPDPELTIPLPPAETNGHAINTEANAWIAGFDGADPSRVIWGPVGIIRPELATYRSNT